MSPAQDDFEEAEGGGALSIDRALSAVVRRLKLIVALPVLAGLIAMLAVLAIPNRYDASAIVQIDPRDKSIAKLDDVVSSLSGDQSTIESEVEIVASRPIVLRVIEILDLRNDPEFTKPNLLNRIGIRLGLLEPQSTVRNADRVLPKSRDQISDILDPDIPGQSNPERDEVAVAFYDRLKVMRVRNTLLIDIRFSATSSMKAARIANTIAEVYLKEQLDAKRRAASTATYLLEEKIEEMQKRVSDAERKVERWKALNGVFDTEGQLLSEKQLARLMEQTVIARNATSEARAKYRQAEELAKRGDRGTALVEVLQSHTVRLLKEQLATVSRRSAELSTKYGPLHPEMIKIRAEMSQAQRQVEAEIKRLVDNLKNESEVAERRERELAQSFAQLKEREIVSKDSSVELKELEREAATSKDLLEVLMTRYKQTAETQGFQLPDARIVEKADAPLFPASPKRKQLVIMATAGGFVLAVALALLLDLMAPGIMRPEDIETALAMAHLSSLPQHGAGADGAPSPAPVLKSARLIVAEPTGRYADAVRNARRELDQRRPVNGPRIILVAASLPGEGADVIASNLAHHYAVTGARTLLIDADFRLQTLTRLLAAERSFGLLDQIANGRPVQDAVLRDQMTGLHFLPAASPAPAQISIPEAMSSMAMAHALAGLKNDFDTIIISAPPLLPVLDTRILADHVDQIMFVMRWQSTPRQLAKKAIKSLGFNADKLSGAVLSDVSAEVLDDEPILQRLFARRGHTGTDQWGHRSAA